MIDIAYFYLGVAILTEIVATSALKASDGFTRLLPAAIAVAGYVASFYCLSLALRTLPLGIAYALWSGAGILLLSLIGWVWYRQRLDGAAILGLCLIIAGILVIKLFSRSVGR
ncbi:small multidrug resistance pump [Stella humosa]|uniref:Small multidrug resistance pump n=1 Tax=Stella humosa TaxID=94 RepID=A0A3N1L187_9PROT|nr:small multidrug resistance pump [Stella humosa]BBK29942.1 multidrug SMR transporter [Stella humosa]